MSRIYRQSYRHRSRCRDTNTDLQTYNYIQIQLHNYIQLYTNAETKIQLYTNAETKIQKYRNRDTDRATQMEKNTLQKYRLQIQKYEYK